MSNKGMYFIALVDVLADEMRTHGAVSAELSADMPKLGVHVTVKVEEMNQ